MFKQIINYYRISSPRPLITTDEEKLRRLTRKLQIQTFCAALIGHSLYYVCRTGLNIVKTPIVDSGLLNDQELGVVGSALLLSYAVGKFVNSFLADHCNVNRFMATGLIISALANLTVGILGLTTDWISISSQVFFICFAILWGINGWAQSMGTAPPIVSLSRWFTQKERGTYYGFFSSGHNIGEFLSFGIVGTVVSYFGWKDGFFTAACAGVVGIAVIKYLLHDSPESKGLPAIGITTKKNINQAQKETLRNPYVWILALSSACMYVSRYAINGWGVRFLEMEKGYPLENATWIVSINALVGIFGAAFSGWFSDKVFKGKRNMPALIFGVTNTLALTLFLWCGNSLFINALSMFLFGLSIGVLICYLGGLMATDIAPRNATGAAVGMVGLVSYFAAGLQDLVSGYLIEHYKVISPTGETIFNFVPVSIFWIGASTLSFILALGVWKAKRAD